MSGSKISGIWKEDSVRDTAESLGLTLSDEVAQLLTGEIEFRIWEMAEEAIKFMSHARRTKLTASDVKYALAAKNYEPLFGLAGSAEYKKLKTPTGTVYVEEDTEIDLTKSIKMGVVSIPREISYSAHWLAIEGVQPLIKENPTVKDLAKLAKASTVVTNKGKIPALDAGGATTVTPLIKHVLSRELQLYFTRLTDALSSTPELKEAALNSVKSDPGLHQLVPYLISWGGSHISTSLDDLQKLDRALGLYHAVLENETLYIEPYLHQLLPPILTCLLSSSISTTNTPESSYLSPLGIRTSAASLLHLIIERYAHTYDTLLPRITKTLLRGLGGEERGLGARWGASRGLISVLQGKTVQGGAKSILEWIGADLSSLGDLIGADEEDKELSKEDVAKEILNLIYASLKALDADGKARSKDSYGPLFDAALEAHEHGKFILSNLKTFLKTVD